ncbi:MFS transporter [Streptomyces antnestii]|nr:MFS transporter [Streptomyces sp. San01]
MVTDAQINPPPGVQAGAVEGTSIGLRSVVGFLIFVELVSGIVQGFYPPLIPHLGSAVHVGGGELNWFSSVQLLAAAVSVPVVAKLGDMYGHRRLLRIAVAGVALGSLLIACSRSFPVMLAGRALQGPLAAWIALEVAIVRDKIGGDTARRSIGLLASALTAGAVIGALVSGPLDTHLGSLRLTLTVPAVLTGLCLLVTVCLIPESRSRATGRIDWAGVTGLATALVLVLLGLSQAAKAGWGSGRTLGPVAAGLVVLAVWVGWERRASEPLVDMRLFVRRAMWPAQVGALLFGVSLFGAQVPLATFLAANPHEAGYGFGLSSQSISYVLALNVLAAVVGAALYGGIARLAGMRGVLPLGLLVIVVSYAWLGFLHSDLWMILVAIPLAGFGTGLLLGGLPAYVSEVAPANQVGIASGTYSTIKVLGGSVASAVFGVLLATSVLSGTKIPALEGYVVVWFACAGTALLGVVTFLAGWATKGARADLSIS